MSVHLRRPRESYRSVASVAFVADSQAWYGYRSRPLVGFAARLHVAGAGTAIPTGQGDVNPLPKKTPDEVEPRTEPRKRTAYMRVRRKRSMTLAFRSPDEKARYEDLAQRASGMSLNAFVLELLAQATSGNVYPTGYVEDLKARLDKLTLRYDTLQDELAELRAELKVVRQEKEDYRVLATELLAKDTAPPTGPQAAAQEVPA